MSSTIEAFFLILCASFVFTTLLSRVPLLRIPSAVGYLLFADLFTMLLITPLHQCKDVGSLRGFSPRTDRHPLGHRRVHRIVLGPPLDIH
jgi:hypothetical protein